MIVMKVEGKLLIFSSPGKRLKKKEIKNLDFDIDV